MKLCKPKYSGKKSKKFWRKINGIDYDIPLENGDDRGSMYSLACDLQNAESELLNKINALIAARNAVKKNAKKAGKVAVG
jgi:hypothetical protein